MRIVCGKLLIFFLINANVYSDYFCREFEQCQKNLNRQLKDKDFFFKKTILGADYLHYKSESSKLLIISSGVHGVEGFVGSAIQSYILDKYLGQLKEQSIDILLIHGLNHWGFKNKRRVDEKNRDLNRNFLSSFNKANNGYVTFKDHIAPNNKAQDNTLINEIIFTLKTAYKSIIYGKENMKQAIVGGQYEFSKGPFYGGEELSRYGQEFKRYLDSGKEYKTIIHVDLHTGYGERGKLHIWSPLPKKESERELLKILFKDQLVFNNDSEFYETTGDFTVFSSSFLNLEKLYSLTFEYGTLDSQTLLGSIKSLYRIVKENQAYHFGCDDCQNVQNDFDEMFNPSERKWQDDILKETDKGIASLIELLKHEK